MIANKDWKAIWTKLWTLIKSITGDVDVKGKGTIQAQLDKKPELDGTNATGDWDINITGKATSATYASTSTKAGTATYATNAGTASYGTKAGTATYATNSGTSSYGTKAGTATYATSAGTADKLKNARTIRTNLASTATASFDGSGNVTPGVTGILPVKNGGTGENNLADSANALINGLPEFNPQTTFTDYTPVDNDYLISHYTEGGEEGTVTNTYVRILFSSLWTYVKNKISDILGLTASSYSGNAKTATSATTATKAGTATYATNSGTATYSSNGAKATSATSATYASTAVYAKSAPTYKGATTAASGTVGLVPIATTATRTNFLRGDGTWAVPSKATSATSATYATTATKAGTATYATNSGTATYSSNGAKATSATSATYATTATKAGTATYASNIANNLTTTGSGYALDARQGAQLYTYIKQYSSYGTQLHSTSEITGTHYIDLAASLTDYRILEFDCYLTDSALYLQTIRVPRDFFVKNSGCVLNLAGGVDYIFISAGYVSSAQIKYSMLGISTVWSSVVSKSMTVRLRGLK